MENGRVVKLEGEADHPVNRGWICERCKGFIEHTYHHDRLNYPMRRVGEKGEGKWEKISWAQALDEIAHDSRNLHDVKPGFSQPSGSVHVFLDRLFDVFFGHLFYWSENPESLGNS